MEVTAVSDAVQRPALLAATSNEIPAAFSGHRGLIIIRSRLEIFRRKKRSPLGRCSADGMEEGNRGRNEGRGGGASPFAR